jgi:hypothetical protein
MPNEVDYDLIYKKLEKNDFNCSGIFEINCTDIVDTAKPNYHTCLLYGRRGCGTEKAKEILRDMYYQKTIQSKLKAILE